MSFDKTVNARVWGVTNQNADTRMPIGDSTGNAHTSFANPLRGTALWDECIYVLRGVSVAGGATGGSYTVTVESDAAVVGYTGLPIARATGIGRNTASALVLTNLHNSGASPVPTHINIDQTATGGGIWFQCWAIARQYRGVLGTPGSASSERILSGTMLRAASYSGGAMVSGKGFDSDETIAVGASFSTRGMHRMRYWDHAFFWAVAGNSVSGSHDVDIVGSVGGSTFAIATTGVGGAVDAADEVVAIASNCGGGSPNPSAMIWTEVTSGGVSDARIVMMAKSGRGSMAKS